MRQRIVATASAMVLALGLAAAPVLAGPPTEISVTPNPSNLWMCAYANILAWTQYWTVGLSGGTSGSYFVTVHYGDGSVKSEYRSGSYDTHHDFVCHQGYYYQSWSATRGGGGTGYYDSWVYTYS